MSNVHAFTQTLFFAPQDRPEGQNFDLDFSYLFNQVSPWLEKYIEGLLGIEGFKIVRGFDTTTFKTTHHAGQVFKLSIEDIEVSNAVTAFSLWIFDAYDTKHELTHRKAYARPRPLWIKAPLTHQDVFPKPLPVKTVNNSLTEITEHNKKDLEKLNNSKSSEFEAPKERSWGINDQRYTNVRNRLMTFRGKLTIAGLADVIGVDLNSVNAMFAGDYVMDSKFLELEKKVNDYIPSVKKTELSGHQSPNWHPSLKYDEPLHKELREMIEGLKVTQLQSVKELGINAVAVSLIKTGKPANKEIAKKIYAHYKAHPEFFQEPVKAPLEEPKPEVVETKKEESQDLFTKTLVEQTKEEVENPWEDLQTRFDLISKSSAVVAELVGYPLATIVAIRESTAKMPKAHYEALDAKVSEVLLKKAKGQLKFPTNEAVIEPVKTTVTMPKFPEAVVKTDREIRVKQQDKEIFYDMRREMKELIATLSLYTPSSIASYLCVTNKSFGLMKYGTISISSFSALKAALVKLKNVEDPSKVFQLKSEIEDKKRELRFKINAEVSKLKDFNRQEIANLIDMNAYSFVYIVSGSRYDLKLKTYEEVLEKLQKLTSELTVEAPVKAPETVPAPLPVMVTEKPKAVKSLSEIKKVVKPAMVGNIHPSGIRIPKFDEKALASRAKDTLKSYRGNSSVVSRTVHRDCFMRNRQRLMIISKHIEEVAKLTGIHQNLVKRAFNHNNPPSSQEQVMFFLYLNDIKSTLAEIEAFNEAHV